MEKEPSNENKPELAESFGIEFLNSKGLEARTAMYDLGGFVFRKSGSTDNGTIYFEGERNDGTTIRMEIKKGENYKSPAEIERARIEEEAKKAEQIK